MSGEKFVQIMDGSHHMTLPMTSYCWHRRGKLGGVCLFGEQRKPPLLTAKYPFRVSMDANICSALSNFENMVWALFELDFREYSFVVPVVRQLS